MNKWILCGLVIGLGFSCSVKTDKNNDKLALSDSLFALKKQC
jgi:hypothetical protein